MVPKIQVEFRITGIQVLPDKITQLLKLNPTRTWSVGDFIQGTKLRRKHNGWCFAIDTPEVGYDLEKYILPLVEALLPSAQLIRQVCEKYDLSSEISCAIYLVDETPTINLSPKVISDMASLKFSNRHRYYSYEMMSMLSSKQLQ